MGYSTKYLYCHLRDFALVVVTYSDTIISKVNDKALFTKEIFSFETHETEVPSTGKTRHKLNFNKICFIQNSQIMLISNKQSTYKKIQLLTNLPNFNNNNI